MPRMSLIGLTKADDAKLDEWGGGTSSFDICTKCSNQIPDGTPLDEVNQDLAQLEELVTHMDEPKGIKFAVEFGAVHPPYGLEWNPMVCVLCGKTLTWVDHTDGYGR